ncbi:MAG: endolytic transglycosylase MltG [Patescibacteria group bacterium]|nr:endolytic transglycosylase MltG [Patescibacteria group bacterium]
MPEHEGPPSSSFHRILSRSALAAREARLYERILPAAFLIGTLFALIYYVAFSAPSNFTVPSVIQVSESETLEQIATQLQQAHAIRSALLFEVVVRAIGGNKRIQAGSYFFPAQENLFVVALRFVTGDFELYPVRITFAEGATSREIGWLLAEKLAPFNEAQFLALAVPQEGYLFPDTYFFFPDQDPTVVERAMEEDFNKHVATIQPQVTAFGKPLSQVTTMASILVGEARTDTDRRIVAGILWKRISLGMPLQVDAPFGYVLNKSLTQLTIADIQTPSPYNTYLNKGLPPTPIGSPSLEAFLAAVTPIKTSYLFYLSDRNGVMHYSVTFAEHQAQIREYLR